jgi:serine/threonine-protein kinase
METPKAIGPYRILGTLGKGGMGAVFRAEDPSCGRTIAIKQILPALTQKHPSLLKRFLKEATIASRLTHPSIIPVYSIHQDSKEVYYTMPFVEGETLRNILRTAREMEKAGGQLHPLGSSIPALARIFLQICEGVSYAHSMGVIHRDLKPENIMVGKYGELFILDWGIANFVEEKMRPPSANGKVAGTLAYMAPERLTGKSTPQTDLYALGVILYQLLTLQLPFHRKTLSHFQQQAADETLIDPIELAPYREIPTQLSQVCKKCLAYSETDRYKTADELIADIKHYTEGRPEWRLLAELDASRNSDWAFQEHISLSRHSALANHLEFTEWAFCRISQQSFPNQLQLSTELRVHEKGQGLGILLHLPHPCSPTLEEGYGLWLGSEEAPGFRIFRNKAQVLEQKELFLKSGQWHQIKIETGGDRIQLFVDGKLALSYASHLPVSGGHIGFLTKDEACDLRPMKIHSGSHNIWINCLALPNTLLANGLYDFALQEYRRIGQSFPGRAEGREALFRAGLTLLKKGLHQEALTEFAQLHNSSGAPLEYLGKSLVHKELGEFEEETKCLEQAAKKFPKHPLQPMVHEQILYRMHESSLNCREAAYRMILLALRHTPQLFGLSAAQTLLRTLKTHWEPLFFLEEVGSRKQEKSEVESRKSEIEEERSSSLLSLPTSYFLDLLPDDQTKIVLAFWLKKASTLTEMVKEGLKQSNLSEILLGNLFFALLELDQLEPGDWSHCMSTERAAALTAAFSLKAAEKWLRTLPLQLEWFQIRSLHSLLRRALATGDLTWALALKKRLERHQLPDRARPIFNALYAWILLLNRRGEEALTLLDRHPEALRKDERSSLHFVYGAALQATRGADAATAHFSNLLGESHPWTTALPSYVLTGRIDRTRWEKQAFHWEKAELDRQLSLFQQSVSRS